MASSTPSALSPSTNNYGNVSLLPNTKSSDGTGTAASSSTSSSVSRVSASAFVAASSSSASPSPLSHRIASTPRPSSSSNQSSAAGSCSANNAVVCYFSDDSEYEEDSSNQAAAQLSSNSQPPSAWSSTSPTSFQGTSQTLIPTSYQPNFPIGNPNLTYRSTNSIPPGPFYSPSTSPFAESVAASSSSSLTPFTSNPQALSKPLSLSDDGYVMRRSESLDDPLDLPPEEPAESREGCCAKLFHYLCKKIYDFVVWLLNGCRSAEDFSYQYEDILLSPSNRTDASTAPRPTLVGDKFLPLSDDEVDGQT